MKKEEKLAYITGSMMSYLATLIIMMINGGHVNYNSMVGLFIGLILTSLFIHFVSKHD